MGPQRVERTVKHALLDGVFEFTSGNPESLVPWVASGARWELKGKAVARSQRTFRVVSGLERSRALVTRRDVVGTRGVWRAKVSGVDTIRHFEYTRHGGRSRNRRTRVNASDGADHAPSYLYTSREAAATA